MSDTPEWPPSKEAMHSLLPAFEFTSMVTSSELGAVFFANQKSLDRQVAVKIFSPMLAADTSFRKAFEKSSSLAAGLRHTNLIGFFDSGNAGGMPYLVTEFVPGKSLARSTRGQIVEFSQALTIIDAICEGLAHAHEAGLVHGHLDTLSILLNQQAAPKIGNFGLGRAVHTDPDVKIPRHFTAPEVLVEPTAARKESDVFSLAAIFYELITGKHYAPGSPPASTLCGCRPAIDTVLKRATDADPEKRFENASAFQTALKKAADINAADKKVADKKVADKKGADKKVADKNAEDKKVVLKKAAESPSKVASPAAQAILPPSEEVSNTALMIKAVIIVVLLFAILFTWQVMKKSHADRDKLNLEILAKQKAAKEAAAALIAEQQSMEQIRRSPGRPVPDVSGVSGVDIPRFEKEVETPERSLARLRSALASGRRSEMPVGSVKKGERDYFLVDEPKSWAEASLFAEEHGAHLASPDVDLGWLNELTKGRECWLGAARSRGNDWILSDGKPWSPPSQPNGEGLFLISTLSGGLASSDEGKPRPFVIVWHADGSNPGSLDNLLASTRASLGSASPVFPPGTIIFGERRYLFVPRPVTWEDAKKLADDGGGHLLVASSTEEIENLKKITRPLKSREGIWLGGSLEDDQWLWVTGEPWQAAGWADDAKDLEEDGVALAIRPGKGWIAMERDKTASAFLIEWSEDQNAPKSKSTSPAVGDKIAELDARVKQLILAVEKTRDTAHAANVKKFNWDLDGYLRGLSATFQQQWKPHIDALKECVVNDRFVTSMIEERGIALSPLMAKVIKYHSEKEVEIDAKFLVDAGKIRDSYVAKLAVIRDEAKAAGQPKVATAAGETIDNAKDLKYWLRNIGG